ncbi:MAG TPA: response regulator, partial [Variovorax sp.]|nr:response regulator [Variovorax sp.]
MKLLLVEDDPSMQVTLQRALARSRIDVRICGDGALAVEQWRELEPDVVALDLSLPNLDGLQ